MTVDQAIQQAKQFHRAGRLLEAGKIYTQILQQIPNHPDALHLLGLLALQGGNLDAAIDLLGQAIRANPDITDAHGSLGSALARKGRLDEAIAEFQKAVELKPNAYDVCNNLGNALQLSHRMDEAIAWYQRAVSIKPDFGDAWSNLGHAFLQKGMIDDSIAASRRAIEYKKNFPAAYIHLGNGLVHKGKLDDAIAAYQRALELKPDSVEALNNLGNALADKGQFTEAIGAYNRAIQIRPDADESHDRLLGVLDHLVESGQSVVAVEAFHRASKLWPNSAEVHNNLANSYLQRGQIDQAIASYQRAMELKPESAAAHGNLLFALIQHPDRSPESVLEAHREWADRHARPLGMEIAAHTNDPAPSRGLRVGFVSPDFYRHSVSRFFMPLLENYDRSNLELFCYANVRIPDAVTEKIERSCDVWRNILGVSDEEAAKQIRDDGIDILVDLSGHTAENRLLIFARKPAPVQVTYLGYANTTGMSAIDYRLTDALADPSGMTDSLHVEQLWRLPTCAWCYQPAEDSPDIQPRGSGPITFGCFNGFWKISPKIVEIWAELLRRIADARLLLKSGGGGDASSQKILRGKFAELGIAESRIEMMGWIDDAKKHMEYYHRVDIALDTYPYHGTTTTCEALWMGVPVVTRMGPTHISRVGVSLLNNVGLPELVARSPEEYVNIAADLAENPSRLRELRMGLRDRMRSGPLLDAKRFTGEVEAAFRQMWTIWCARQTGALPAREEIAHP